jgi:alkylation response protein AidB-like acyl-CoA dehydrogenase
MIANSAAENEKNRRLSQDVFDTIRDADFFRYYQPKKFGGLEFDQPAQPMQCVIEWASADASTGWVCALGIVHQWLIAQFPAEMHEEVWGSDPNATACGSYAPSGECSAVEGGHRLSGNFHFASGVDVTDWAILGVFFPPKDHGGRPVPGFTMVPKSDVTVDDDWHVMGLTGTGSKTIVCKDVFIPAHRRVTFAELVSGNSPGYQALQNNIYRYPLLSLYLDACDRRAERRGGHVSRRDERPHDARCRGSWRQQGPRLSGRPDARRPGYRQPESVEGDVVRPD